MIGPAVLAVLTPGLTFGLVAACRLIERGLPVSTGVLFSGFKDDNKQHAKPLLKLGVLYVMSVGVVILLVSLIMGNQAMDVWVPSATDTSKPADIREQADFLIKLMAFFGVLYLPVMMMFWYAPMLVVWHGFSPVKSMFYSFFAVRRNWRAFLIYGMAWLMGVMLIAAGIGLISEVLSLPKAMMSFIQLPLVFFVFSVTLCSYYPSYVQVFDNDTLTQDSA